MSKDNALAKYTQAMDALKGHQEANGQVFSAHQKLVMAVVDAENELRDAVAESGSGISNGLYSVTYTPQTQTVYDEDKIRATCPEAISVNQRPPRITIGEVRG